MVPGKSAESLLIRVVSGQIAGKVMPPNGPRLTTAQIGLLRDWIDQGLDWDDRLLPPPPKPPLPWAFRPLRRPALPKVKRRDWIRTPVDAYIASVHEARGLTPAPEASRSVLLRRLSLDLTGLPPTLEEVEAFRSDTAPDAYERVVERLLASPHYGERWGRHWLDVARWADSEGYENNNLRPFAWRYRDYVVRSFNSDKPFDRFLKEQIAGDELLPYCDDNLIATGFLAAARYSSNEEDKAMQRNDVLVDITNATASAFLGLTLHCAQCHDHKFDPLTQKDYYRLQGFFVRGQMNNLALQAPELWKEYEAAIPKEYGPTQEKQQALYTAVRSRLTAAARQSLTPEARAALETAEGQRTPEQRERAKQAEASLKIPDSEVESAFTEAEKREAEALKKALDEFRKRLPPKPQTIGFYSPATSPTPVEVMQMEANYPLPYEPESLKKTRPRLLLRGDAHRPGEVLEAGWPALFGPTPAPIAQKGSRSALADWLTSPSHPLTARVWANRVWQYHFGRGLCATPGDFGVKSAPPSHPELLDYLASELIRSGWSAKHLHRLIVLSSAYRQASRPHTANARKDPANRSLWRWMPRRLEAEAIRDMLLAVSGELDRAVGGPGVPLKNYNKYVIETPSEDGKTLRRSLYLRQMRDFSPPMQALFDGPTANESCPRRHVSTVALQPLFLLNSAFVVDRAKAFAQRVAALAGRDPGRQVETAFRLALSRPPDSTERGALLRFLEEAQKERPAVSGPEPSQPLMHLCHLLFNLDELITME